jgi:type IV secretion system protein VirB4
MGRFVPLDKKDARRAITTLRKRWFSERKSVLALLKEAITHDPSALEDPDALQKTGDADSAPSGDVALLAKTVTPAKPARPPGASRRRRAAPTS